MKKLALVLITFLITSCETFQPLEKSINFFGFDFTKYTAKDFLITPQNYSGDYESIGLITVHAYPKIRRAKDTELGSVVIENLNYAEVIDSFYVKADRMGANAIINFNVRAIDKVNGLYKLSGFEASGFAIKRKLK